MLNKFIKEQDSEQSFRSNLDVQLRFLSGPEDIPEVRALCEDTFPIEYPISWYEDITGKTNRFYSLAATFNNNIIGILIAEIKSWNKLNKEDKTILSENLGKKSSLAYILSLGVNRKYRRNGIATLLLETFITHLTQSSEQNDSRIKAVFLHVLSTNQPAIVFYEKHNFVLHSFLPYYYSIKGKSKDGFSYVNYINGGTSPITFTEQVKNCFFSVFKFNICSWVSCKTKLIFNWLTQLAFHKIHYFRR